MSRLPLGAYRFLTEHDVLCDDDLVRDLTPDLDSGWIRIEDPNGWHLVSERLSAWVGKSLYDLHVFYTGDIGAPYNRRYEIIRKIKTANIQEK